MLQHELQNRGAEVWVGNAGLDGHSTWGHRILMEEVISKIRPDALILLVGINDLSVSFSAEEVATYDNRQAHWLTQSQLFNVLWLVKQIMIDGVHVMDDVGGYDTFVPLKIGPDVSMSPLPNDLRELLPSFQSGCLMK